MSPSNRTRAAGTESTSDPATSPWRPLVIRAVIGALALLGLSGIGAVSMVAGLDGAHASSPSVGGTASALASASAGPAASVSPAAVASAPQDVRDAGSCRALTEDGRVVLNLAGLEELRKLPGIGPKRAEAILQLRAKLKRFKRGADLLRVRGIGAKSLARMQSHFVVDPPPGANCPVPNAASSK